MSPQKKLELTSEEITSALEKRDYEALKTVFSDAHASDIAEILVSCPTEQIAEVIRMLRAPKGIEAFAYLNVDTQAEVIKHLGRAEIIKILEELSPDDRADLLRKMPAEAVDSFLPLMAQAERDDMRRLLQYGENTAGALMTTEYASLPADTTLADTLKKLHSIAPDRETIYYIYVTDLSRHLIGIVSLREIIVGRPTQRILDIMSGEPISVGVDTDQEEVARTLRKYDLIAVPVVDLENRLVGIVTHDDVMDVMVAEQTEDIQKIGGMEALHAPYLQIAFSRMVRKRAGWLSALFVGEMLTATAMAFFQDEIARAVVLALFVPLIISSGGNSGSQASTLVIRAMAVGEVKLRDWWRVVRRELAAGVVLGAVLGSIGLFRIVIWQAFSPLYGPHYFLVALTVFASLVGVVTFGTLAGSFLPFILRRLGFDPASASAPFVATLVDVTGLVIYFSVASYILQGTLL